MKTKASYEIVFQDEHHLVVNKASGVGCLSDRYDLGRDSLLELLREQWPGAILVHRIDLETSGLVLVALHTEAMRWLSMQFQERRVKKQYLAFAAGFVPFEELEVRKPVGEPVRGSGSSPRRDGEEAVTVIRRLRNYRGFAKVLCLPETGRFHQIRIHLSDLGLPVVGDLKYGGQLPLLSRIKKGYVRSDRKADQEEVPLLRRLALHAWKIEYVPYGSESSMKQEAPIPKDLASFEAKLEKYA